MALGYFMSAFVPSGARPQGALPVPPLQYFKLPSAGKNKLLRGSQGKGGGGKIASRRGGKAGQVGWITYFLLLHHCIFIYFFFLRH